MFKRFFNWLRSLFKRTEEVLLKRAELLGQMKGWKMLHQVRYTVRDPHLALWQSATEEAIHKMLGGKPRPGEVLRHPLMQVVCEHIRRVEQKVEIAAVSKLHSVEDNVSALAHASHLLFQRSLARVQGEKGKESALHAEVKRRKYENGDPMFLTIIPIFEAYYLGGLRNPIYRDWKKEGKENIDYGVIPWQLPAGAKVGILGDWGTGMEDAEAIFADMVKREPDAIIHLGDIYYAGTDHQGQQNFLDVIDRVFQDLRPGKPRIPVFNMGGNHDYYARGTGFYLTLDNVNAAMDPKYKQAASYFCLRTEDKSWQILGMDTGVNDHKFSDAFSPFYRGPSLEDSEVLWHQDKLSDDAKNASRTLLLSHHQLFSQYSVGSALTKDCYLNQRLLDIFKPYFNQKIRAWVWGHEHSFCIFNDGLFGLAKGRLLGCSAYEQPDPTKPPPHAAQVPAQPVKLGTIAGFNNHGYAMIQFPAADAASKDLQVTYYQYPSWGIDQNGNPPPPLADPVLAREVFTWAY